ncbi:MAG: hypothetical protein SGILL_001857 [Bacillariaceae sp.]
MKFGTSARRSDSSALNLKGDDKEDEPLRFRSIQSMVREQDRLVSNIIQKEEHHEKKMSSSRSKQQQLQPPMIDEETEQLPKLRRTKSLATDGSSSTSSKRSSTKKSKSKRSIIEEEEERPKLRKVKSMALDSGRKSSSSKKQDSGSLAKKLQKDEQRSLRRAQSMVIGGRNSSDSKSVSSRKSTRSSRSSRTSGDDPPRKPRKSKSMIVSDSSGSRSFVEGSSRSISRRSSGSSRGEERRLSKSKSFVQTESLSSIRLNEQDDEDSDDDDQSIELLGRKDRSFVKKDSDEEDDLRTVSLHSRSVKVDAAPVSKAELMLFLTEAEMSATSMASVSSNKSRKSDKKKVQRSKSFAKRDHDDEATATTSRSSSDEDKFKHRRISSSKINTDSVNKILAESVAREIFTDEGGDDDLESGISELGDSVSYRLDQPEQDSLYYYNEKSATMGDGLMKVDVLGDAVNYHAADHPETLMLEFGDGGGDNQYSSKVYKMLRTKRRLRFLCIASVVLAFVAVFSLGLAFGLYQKNKAVTQASAAGSAATPSSAFVSATTAPEKVTNIEIQDNAENEQIGGRIPPPMKIDASADGNSFMEGLDISCEPNC